MTRKLLVLVPVLLCLIAAPALAATVRVKANRTPLRASPSTASAVLDQLKAGAVLDLVDVDRDWYKVRDPLTKKEGYVLASLVDLQPGPSPAAGAAAPGAGAAGARPAPTPASRPAPPPKPGDWTGRGYLWVNGIFEGGASAVTQTQSWSYFAETATANIEYPAKNAPGVDVSAGFRVWRNLAIGAGVTAVSRSTTTVVTGSIPNPLYLNRPNTLAGGFGSSNSETAVNLQVAWVFPVSPRLTVTLVGGPSIFSVNQTIVQPQGIGITSAYPYDSGAITSATTADVSKTAMGFAAGADISYFFSKTVGVGGMIRFARASASFPVTGQPAVAVDAGGFQVGGGLRILFPAPKTARPAAPAKPPSKPQPKPGTPPKKK
jgi:Bacterial SH3 domain